MSEASRPACGHVLPERHWWDCAECRYHLEAQR